MEMFGGFMVMIGILGFFLAVVWLIMPFVVIAIKGKQDRTLELLTSIEGRLANLESRLPALPSPPAPPAAAPRDDAPTGSDDGIPGS